MSDRQILGEILGLALRDLGNYDDYELVKSGSFRFHAETGRGWGGVVEVDIIDMCAEASEKIEQLQKELDEAIEIIEFSGVDYDEVLEAIRNDQ